MSTRTDQLGITSFLKFHSRGGGRYYARSYDTAGNEWAPSGDYSIERGEGGDTGWYISHVDYDIVNENGNNPIRRVGHTTTFRAAKEAAQDDYNSRLSASEKQYR